MSFLDTRHKKKSFTLTTVLLALLAVLLFYLGLSYMDPPPESGITVNFGMTEFGSGEIQPKEKVQSAPQEEKIQEEQPEETVTEQEPAEVEEPQEEVLTDDTEDAPVISPKEEKKPVVTEETPKPVEEKPKEEPKKPSKSTTDALSNILNGPKTEGTENAGEGDDSQAGDKGNPEGDPYASSHYGSPGSGSGGVGYGLNGRSLLSKGKVQQDCNEEGRVVVKIEVDKNGNVIDAVPGVKGTTNNHPCLLDPAKKTALMFKWNPDSDAPSRQIGFVVINFKLGD
ncbi:energy transducer TonB [Sinomicrobium weinanense]|uniref:Energy transducer TonB n=1 Tax=Sinomicrobium weinanense TaxID=2842200 RepID=A0A926JTD6_9FLAO|nr:energy transducer TonB [Sinomicrobium weinanense]MBC9797158.1 energy transducer TonB [Sinomicrobium weinanense]MBU3124499.1 energy transducer TonB [Sinomicrobium weinanense]